MALVKLDSVNPELKPGMTSLVDIALRRRNNVLAVPCQALRSDGGKKICFVANAETLERREVRTGEETTNLVEVTSGLEEGELIALNPPNSPTHAEPLVNFDELEASLPAASDTVAASRD